MSDIVVATVHTLDDNVLIKLTEEISEVELLNAIKASSVNKAPGSDGFGN